MGLGFFFPSTDKTAAPGLKPVRTFSARIACVARASSRQPALPAEETKRENPREQPVRGEAP